MTTHESSFVVNLDSVSSARTGELSQPEQLNFLNFAIADDAVTSS